VSAVEAIEKFGLWWIPGREHRTIGGILTFNREDGIRLGLGGTLFTAEEHDAAQRYALPVSIVYGTVEQLGAITLWDGHEANTAWIDGEIYKQEIRANGMLVGAHVSSPAFMRLTRIRVSFRYLLDWLGTYGFDHRLNSNPGNDEPNYTLTYREPDPIVIELADARLTVGHALSASRTDLYLMSQQQIPWIEFAPMDPIQLGDAFRRYVRPMQDFLTLVIGRPVQIETVDIFCPDITTSGGAEKPVRLYRDLTYWDDDPKRAPYMLLRRVDVADRLADTLQRWFRVADRLDSVCDLYFSVLYRPQTYLENKFLNLVQALESFHSRTRENKDLPTHEHRKRVAAIAEASPEQYRDWVRRKLQHANQPSLSDRLGELIGEYDDLFHPVVRDRKVLIDRIVATRNYYTHFTRDRRQVAAIGDELRYLNHMMSLLIQACFVGELGFSGVDVHKILADSMEFRLALRQYSTQ
jgi:hypothetical protein